MYHTQPLSLSANSHFQSYVPFHALSSEISKFISLINIASPFTSFIFFVQNYTNSSNTTITSDLNTAYLAPPHFQSCTFYSAQMLLKFSFLLPLLNDIRRIKHPFRRVSIRIFCKCLICWCLYNKLYLFFIFLSCPVFYTFPVHYY